jgi:hypothetical protein
MKPLKNMCRSIALIQTVFITLMNRQRRKKGGGKFMTNSYFNKKTQDKIAVVVSTIAAILWGGAVIWLMIWVYK